MAGCVSGTALACGDGNGTWFGDGGLSDADATIPANVGDAFSSGAGGSAMTGGTGGSAMTGGTGGIATGGSGGTTAGCTPTNIFLAAVPPNGGSSCTFPFQRDYTVGEINLLLTPGWGTVCHAGSSSNCGSGASADGWWISGDYINLCDASCDRFYRQTQAGKLTVQLGCPTKPCMHR